MIPKYQVSGIRYCKKNVFSKAVFLNETRKENQPPQTFLSSFLGEAGNANQLLAYMHHAMPYHFALLTGQLWLQISYHGPLQITGVGETACHNCTVEWQSAGPVWALWAGPGPQLPWCHEVSCWQCSFPNWWTNWTWASWSFYLGVQVGDSFCMSSGLYWSYILNEWCCSQC